MKANIRSKARLGKAEGPLATVLASSAMARLVAHFVLRPRSALHFQAVRRATGLATRSLQIELARLEHLGLVERIPEGRVVRFRAVAGHSGWTAFRSLVREFADPAEVLRVAFSQLEGVDAAFIYGSFALKTDIHPASDVDVVVVGTEVEREENRLALAKESLEAAGLLGREVNVRRYTWDKLRIRTATGGRFLRDVLGGAKQWIVGDQSALGRLRRVGVTR
jgi:predicted nucleotidyltransferase